MGLLGFGLGLLTVNTTEWVAHKYLLHGLGKRKGSIFSFHWKRHHNSCRKNDFYDADYELPALRLDQSGRETWFLLGAAAGMAPWSLLSPSYYTGVCVGTFAYYYLHKRSHMNPEWAKKWMPWHYAHHMSANQDRNWCVTFPAIDLIMGTSDFEISRKGIVRKQAQPALRLVHSKAAV